MTVPAKMHIVTLGVSDLERSRAFYEAIGWELARSSVRGVIYWFPTTGAYLGLFGYEALAADANLAADPTPPYKGFTLAMNLEDAAAVVAAMGAAEAAGATVLKPPTKPPEFDGLHGYFADPDGYAWEVAFNPSFPMNEDGTITIE